MRIVDESNSERVSKTTVLPPSSTPVAHKGASLHPRLKPLCPKRMAEAAQAEREVAALCEELSQTMRKLPAHRPARGVSNRPSVRRRPARKPRA